MGSFDQVPDDGSGTTDQPAGIPERIGDSPDEHAPAAASDGTIDQPDQRDHPEESGQGAREGAAAHVGIDGPGVPESAQAAAGPTQATTSGSGPAPVAGQDETHAGLTDSVAASEEAAGDAGAAGAPTGPGSTGEPGANGALSSGADPLTELAEDLGLEPGATDAYDAGQDNGLNS